MRTVGSNHAETQERVHAAALRLFARKGFAATGIRELAEEAGLSSAALYHYMGTKEDLLVSIMRSTIEPLLVAGYAILASGEPSENQIATIVETHVWVHGSQPLATKITDSEVRALRGDRLTEVMELRDAYDAIWRRIVAKGVTESRFEVLDERVATLALLELCTGVSDWYRPSGRLGLDELCAIHTDLAFAVLRARRGRRPLRRSDLGLSHASEWIPSSPERTGRIDR